MRECKDLNNALKNNKTETQRIKDKHEFGLHIRCGGLNATTGRITHITKIHFIRKILI